MISKLHIENFRSIEKAEIDLGKITVLTGANNSGKSSVIYALLTLRNILTNPNQSLDNILNLPFINLGGFEQVVYMKDKEKSINIGFLTNYVNLLEENRIAGNVYFACTLNPRSSILTLVVNGLFKMEGSISVAFPYAGNKTEILKYEDLFFKKQGSHFKGSIHWNGLYRVDTLSESLKSQESNLASNEIQELHQGNLTLLSSFHIRTINSLDFTPIRRGFTKPYYNPIPLSSNRGTTEEEIATIISLDRELINKIAVYLEKIVDRYFSIYTTPQPGIFYLQTRHKETGFTTDLVNEGLGTNQLVTLLAKALQKDSKIICIDEPEIHLHPSVISKLVGVLVEIANKEQKQFVISTHSEHFITALLKHIKNEDLKTEDAKVYYLKKEGQKTIIENQPINEKGQIEGGLIHFYETELEDLSSLFNITD